VKRANSDRPTREQAKELALLAARPDQAIDPSDAPEVRGWSGAERGLLCPAKKRKS
jgi:hypothetical protein